MIRVVGLDLSATSTGVALSDGTCRTIRPRTAGRAEGRRLNEIVSRLDVYLRADRPDLAVLEGYNLGPVIGKLAAVVLGEVGGAVRTRLFELGIEHVEIPPKQLKKFATGNGNASKDDMVFAARQSGVNVANDDEADAFFLHALGRSRFSDTWEPAFRCVELLEVRAAVRAAIKWPALEGVR